MKLFALPEDARFKNKEIILFILPIFFEQIIISLMGIIDTYMVSHLGETAVAGVSLALSIDQFVKNVSIALATGGSVVVSQYIGARNIKEASRALKTNIQVIFLISTIACIFFVAFRDILLSFLFGTVEEEVMNSSKEFFSINALSYPFLALYNCGSASFRATGNTRIPFMASICMMVINVALKYIFIFVFKLGVSGAALSTLAAYIITGTVQVIMHCSHKNRIFVIKLFKPEWRGGLIGRITKIALPNGIENGLFNLGALILQRLVSTLGTASIAANALASNISPLTYALSSSFTMAIITFVGQCCGAGDIKGAKFYTKHILKLDYAATIVNAALAILFTAPLVRMYGLSEEATGYAINILYVYFFMSALFYPLSFAMPNALRGTGDTVFTMTVSALSMFLFRIIMAYVFVYVFKTGVIAIWYAMVLDWIIRSLVFVLRYKSGKWEKNHVI